MPSLYIFGSYKVYFWSNEGNEPIHVHISKGKPGPNATKVWLTEDGGCVLASNGSRIPKTKLNTLLELIAAQHEEICESWMKFRNVSTISFYC